jgi:asparagine synthase (glutamine-hydrolysing)
MSGLCGWFAQEPPAVALERMAAPIGRFERTPLRSAAHEHGAAALSGSIDCTSLLHEDGLIVALWGSPGQHARTLAQHWRSHGAGAAAALAGPFAFAILDARRGEALLAVDRCATRPLYYQLCNESPYGHSLVFASSQDALLRHSLAGRRESAQVLFQYLLLGVMSGSAWEGQHQLGPGECVHLRAGQLLHHHWWRMRFNENAQGRRAGLGAAVQAALTRADGHQQTGVMLSGGRASTALAAGLQGESRAGAGPVPTFSVSCAQGKTSGADPGRHAARILGTLHHHQVIEPADLVMAIPKLASLSDRPCAGTSAVLDYHCALLARAHGTLRLYSGAGLAELFGAGPLARVHARMAPYGAIPAPLRELLVEPLQRFKEAAPADLPAHMLHDSPFAPSMLAGAFLEQIDASAPLALLRAWWWSAQCRSTNNRAIALDLRIGLPARLAASQLGCFLAGVDVAHPFLDDAIVDCAARIDPRRKHPGFFGEHARVLRALAPGGLGRGGAATAVPFAAWLQTDQGLRTLAFDSLSDLRRRHIVAGTLIDNLLAAPGTQRAPCAGAMVWQLMMLEQWFVHRTPHRSPGGMRTAPAGAGRALDGFAAGRTQACRADDPLPIRLAK